MLLIGDIHIHPRYCDTTIDMLRDYIRSYPDEQNIIFVGDYVYHFSYHRVSLLALLDFFLELAQQDKQVYILAGNHDRLGQHFVYSEAEKIIQYNSSHHNIRFITTPQTTIIDNQTVIFLPYILNRSEYTPQSDHYSFDNQLLGTQDSKHAQTKASYLLNTYLADEIQKQRLSDPDKDLIVIHHYYTANTRFPGIKAQFGYKDLALSPQRMDEPKLRLISGHIHHSFVYKNYLCIGAVRSTSPLETNQLHYLFHYHQGTISAQQIALNPYLTITNNDTTDEQSLAQHRFQLQHQSTAQFQSSIYDIHIQSCDLPVSRTTLTLSGQSISYDTLHDTISPTLQTQLRDIKIKQDLGSLDVMIEDLVDANKDFSSGRGDRKILLDEYLERKFGDQKEKYIDVLKELKIHS